MQNTKFLLPQKKNARTKKVQVKPKMEVSQQVTIQMGFGSVEKPLTSTWKVKGCRLRNPALRHETHKSMDFLEHAFLTKHEIKQAQERTSEHCISGILMISWGSEQTYSLSAKNYVNMSWFNKTVTNHNYMKETWDFWHRCTLQPTSLTSVTSLCWKELMWRLDITSPESTMPKLYRN